MVLLLLRLTLLGARLVDRARSALLCLVDAHSTVAIRVLDVLVLSLALRAPCVWHDRFLCGFDSSGAWNVPIGRGGWLAQFVQRSHA